MSWRAKEKKLTPEEAIAKAKVDLAPFWFNSEPLFAGIEAEGGSSLFPLSAEFSESHWLVARVDPFSYSSQRTFHLLREYFNRYSDYSVRILGVMQSDLNALLTPAAIHYFLEKKRFKFPLVLDVQGTIAQALIKGETKKLAFVSQSKPVFTGSSEKLNEFETSIQNHLRLSDPGLPLPPCLKDTSEFNFSQSKELRFGEEGEAFYPAPGFKSSINGFKSGTFTDQATSLSSPQDVRLSGVWLQDSQRIITSDPQATLRFSLQGSGLGIVFQPLKETPHGSKVVVDLDGNSPTADFITKDLIRDADGRMILRVEFSALHDLLKDLKPGKREVRVKFIGAQESAIAIYRALFF